MNKLSKNVKNNLNLVWLIVAVMCVVITHYCMKVKATNNYKQILQVATKSCSLEVVKLLVKDIAPNLSEMTLHYAARGGCLDTVKFLIVEKKVNVNTVDKNAFKRIALHHAAGQGHLEVVKFLLKEGANPNIRANDGRNPRDVAVARSRHNKDKPYDEIISLLYNAEKQVQSDAAKP